MDVKNVTEIWETEYSNSNDKYIKLIGKIAIAYIKKHPEEVDKITTGLTLNGCMDFMRDRAKSNQKNGVGVATLDDLYDYFHFGGKAPTILSDEDMGDLGTHSKPVPAPEPAAPKPMAKRVNLSMDDLF
ncbi:hypothetical protein [uncultured Megasphaera sp.]|uniref:hypothetical protein n=1 Tax=uncultured Megasphaera sp. TaxID=165188 RepID=UPI0025EC9DE3|nr:hypothetical protein [uncultured Megasphaera sp.]